MTERLADQRDDDMVKACPECDSASLNQAAGDRYRCCTCGHKFAEATERDRKNETEAGNKGRAKDLADANPEEWL